MIDLNPPFELVKNEGKTRETVLCISRDKLRLMELCRELVRLHNRNKYSVRPILYHIIPKNSELRNNHA